jgi:O-antigen ligase
MAIGVLFAAELTFGLTDHLVELLGRDPTLTGRTEMWKELMNFDINPVLGAGFDGYWEGERLDIMWDRHWWKPNQAHNGYIEIYLDLGLMGLFLLIGVLATTYRKSYVELLRSFEWGQFRLGFLPAVVIYNWTEAAFKNIHPVLFVFFVIAVDYPKRRVAPAERPPEAALTKEDPAMVCAGGQKPNGSMSPWSTFAVSPRDTPTT